MAVGDKLRERRETLRYTRARVAEAAGMNPHHLYLVEVGRKSPLLETIWTLACVLGMNPHELDERLHVRKASSSADPVADFLRTVEKGG